MSYEIVSIDLKDDKLDEELRSVIRKAFNLEEPLKKGHLYLNTFAKKSKEQTLFLAAVENRKIIGCNGFIANDFEINKKIISCYQSCWSATHPDHQGKRVFVNIQEEAQKILRNRGAALIYGLPNDNSRPIFVNKLGFSEIPCLMLQIPNIPYIRNLFNRNLNSNKVRESSVIKADEKQIADLKKNLNKDIIEIEINKSYAWGKLEKKEKFGISMNYFYLGGLEVEALEDYPLLMKEVFNLPSKYVQIVTCQSNLNNEFFNFWRRTKKINPFIFKYLNIDKPDNINFMYGLVDVF